MSAHGEAKVPRAAPGRYRVAMGASSRLERTTVSEARDGLKRVLEAIRAGELTAGPGYVARLEGAVAALEALLGQLTLD
jgi:hypothetical protein